MGVKFCEKCRSLIIYEHCSNKNCEDSLSTDWFIDGVELKASNPITYDIARARVKEILAREKAKQEKEASVSAMTERAKEILKGA